MRKLNQAISTWLFAGIAAIALPYGLTQAIAAQNNLPSSTDQMLTARRLLSEEPASINRAEGGRRISEEPVDKQPGGKRSLICPIAPKTLDPATEVWSKNPMFIWRGNVGRIELQLQGAKDKDVLWSKKDIQIGTKSVTYEGQPLQPGQSYKWAAFDLSNNLLAEVPFKVMNSDRHDRVEQQLRKLEQELKNAKPEEIALRRAQYFAKEQLWSDAWREIYSIKNPSEEVEKIAQSIPRNCSVASRQNTTSSR